MFFSAAFCVIMSGFLLPNTSTISSFLAQLTIFNNNMAILLISAIPGAEGYHAFMMFALSTSFVRFLFIIKLVLLI